MQDDVSQQLFGALKATLNYAKLLPRRSKCIWAVSRLSDCLYHSQISLLVAWHYQGDKDLAGEIKLDADTEFPTLIDLSL